MPVIAARILSIKNILNQTYQNDFPEIYRKINKIKLLNRKFKWGAS
jgi:hypothetical protein